MVHVAASQLTSSKLCSTSNPMAEKPSKFPSPSIYASVSLEKYMTEGGYLRSQANRRCRPVS